jgi:hypothetical protein
MFGALAAVIVRAEAVNREATIIATQGTVTVTPAGGSGAPLRVGANISQGGRIVSGPGGQASIRFSEGTTAVLQPGSDVTVEALSTTTENGKVTKETTTLNLRSGSIVSTLDPDKKSVTDYRVRTPKGVAVAHGTVFAVRVTQDQSNASVTTMSGAVTFISDNGSLSVGSGQAWIGGRAMTIAQAVAADPSLAASLVEAATSMASAIGAGANVGAGQINRVLADLANTAAQAAPNQAAAIAASVLTAAGPALGRNGTAAATAISQAALQGATKVDPSLRATLSQEIVRSIGSVAANPSAQIDLGRVQTAIATGTAPGTSQVVPANSILPPLDQTQVVVSPSR